MAAGFGKIEFSDDFVDTLVAKGDDSFRRYIEYLEYFPSDVAVVFAAQDLACSDQGWELVTNLENELTSSDLVHSVHSIASETAKLVQFDPNQVSIDRFAHVDFANAQDRCDAAGDYEPFRNRLIAEDNRTISFIVVAKKGVNAASFAQQMISIRTAFDPSAESIGGSIFVTGDPVMNVAISEALARDLIFVAALVAVMLALVAIGTRSLRTCSAAGLTIVFSVSSAFGTMGWLGIYLTPGTMLAVFLLVPLSTAFVLHGHGYASRFEDKTSLFQRAAKPTLFAGLTTAFLFGLTGLTSSPDIQALATVGSIGVLAATVSMFLLAFPLLESAPKVQFAYSFKVPRWAFLHPSVSYGILALLLVQCGIGLSQLRFEYEAIDYLPPTNSARAEFDQVGQWFGRMNIPLIVEMGDINDTEKWRALKTAVERLEGHYDNRVQSHWFYDQIGLLMQAFSDSKSAFPETKSEFDQLFMWFEPEDYEGFISLESSEVVVVFSVPFKSSTEYFEFKNQLLSELEAQGVSGELVGRVSSFFETGHKVGLDNLKSLAIGAAVVFLVLVVVFRSVVMASIALVVNLVPALSSLSVLGLSGVTIDLGSSIVTAIAFGIIVDDSTHLMWRVKDLQNAGYDPNTAVLRATRELIAPIVWTSITVCVGFSLLFGAEMRPFHDFAMTIVVALFVAVVADIAILPALVRGLIKDSIKPAD